MTKTTNLGTTAPRLPAIDALWSMYSDEPMNHLHSQTRHALPLRAISQADLSKVTLTARSPRRDQCRAVRTVAE